MTTTIYICPVCGCDLTEESHRFACQNGHAFDRAKEGYVNLLLSSRGGVHGDNRDMILARRRFLELGHYDPLCRLVCERVVEHMPHSGVLLDEGAGECFYTDRMQKALESAGREASVFAFDISRDAVRAAAKRNRSLHLSVAGVYHMPVRSQSVDVVTNLFAPLAPEETHRVLKDGGIFVLAVPEREHLFGLKACLYDTPHKNTVADATLSGFSLISEDELLYTITVEGTEALSDLLRMTPYGYRTPKAGWKRLSALSSLATPVHVRLFVYQKDAVRR